MSIGKIKKKYLALVVEAINQLGEGTYINTSRIRRIHNIDSSDRPKINFIWRDLKLLEEQGYIKKMGKKSPKGYIIRKPINLNNLIEEVYT